MSYSKKAAREAAKLKREPGTFAAVPFAMLRSQSFAALSPQANKLLFDLLAQYNLRNNGDLSMSFEKTMRPRGWKSKDTLNKARLELIEAGFILLTRQGGLHQCSLYAVTFYAVDHCEGKLEMSATRTALSNWRKNEPLKNREPSTRAVPVAHRLGTPAVLKRGFFSLSVVRLAYTFLDSPSAVLLVKLLRSQPAQERMLRLE